MVFLSIEEKINAIYTFTTQSSIEGFFTKYSAIIVALIAFIGVVAQLCISSKTNSRNQEFQREWEQKKINVDLIAKSRLKWIEEVRSIASDLISDFLEFQNLEIIEYERLNILRKNAELLKLYFNSNGQNGEFVEDIKEIKNLLKEEDSNKGKNIYIKKYIDHIIRLIPKGKYSIKYEIISKQNQVAQLRGQIYNLEEDSDYVKIWSDDAKDNISVPTTKKIPEKYQEQANFLFEQIDVLNKYISKKKDENQQYASDISDFREAMSLYLKIEWDRAKEGK